MFDAHTWFVEVPPLATPYQYCAFVLMVTWISTPATRWLKVGESEVAKMSKQLHFFLWGEEEGE